MAKRISLYGILAALCLVLGYVESLVPFDFIAPGVKIGLANSVALLLVLKKDIKGAFLVNIVRILLSALLFASPAVLIYSLSAGVLSLVAVSLFSKLGCVGAVGISVVGAVIHNLTQLVCATLLLGGGVWYYLPFLLISALISGCLVGIVATITNNKFKHNF